MTEHRQVPVKVNAWVDEGIAGLVTALSEFEGLVTLETCQGHVEERDAFVVFRYGDWQRCGELLFGRILPTMSPDLRADVSLRLQAYDADTALGSITLEPAAVSAFTQCLRDVLATPVGASVFVTRNAHRKVVA
jgi:hypothetical protein